MSYTELISSIPTSSGAQHSIESKEMIMGPNNNGGVSFSLSRVADQALACGDWKTYDRAMLELLRRVMIMGTNTMNYVVCATDLTADAIQFLDRCVRTNRWGLILQEFREVYGGSLAPKLGFAITSLAYLTSISDTVTGNQKRTAEIRSAAYKLVPTLRIGTHLLQWNALHMVFCKKYNVKGTGAGYRKAVLAWFTARSGQQLAYQVTKYGSREGMSFRDLVRLAHPKPSRKKKNCQCKKRNGYAPCDAVCQADRYTPEIHRDVLSPEHQIVLSYVAHGIKSAFKKLVFLMESEHIQNMSVVRLEKACKVIQYLCAVDCARSAQTPHEEIIRLIGWHQLPREGLNTEHLRSTDVWATLLCGTGAQKGIDWQVVYKMTSGEDFDKLIPLVNQFSNTHAPENKNIVPQIVVPQIVVPHIVMPITALLRNLAKLSQIKLFDAEIHPEGPQIERMVCQHLANPAVLIGGKMHPLNVMSAWATYRRGCGLLGGLTWTPSPKIIEALNTAFYHSFHTLKGTGKKCLHGIDASESMRDNMTPVSGLSAAEVCAVMAMAYYRTETQHALATGKRCYQYMGYFSIEFTEYTEEVTVHTTFEEMCSIVQRSDWNITDIGRMFEFACVQLQHSLDDFLNQLVVDLPVQQWKGFYEVFLVWTDNDVNSGKQPMIVMKQYNDLVAKCFLVNPCNEDGSMGNAKDLTEKHLAKLVVIATVPTEFTIGDPTDPNVLNMSGFDLSGPTILHNFLTGFSEGVGG